MRHISLQVTQVGIKSPVLDQCIFDEVEAIRRELNTHNQLQRARYRARRQGRAHLTVLSAV